MDIGSGGDIPITEFKTKCEFNGVDFEADLSTMYAEMRRCIVVDFPEKIFAPKLFSSREKNLRI